ncbi:MAG: hypothetical protein M3442_19600 [Chloroflexota bacterium]|nr:hypothetical protein [Chloroflexota bacterium]
MAVGTPRGVDIALQLQAAQGRHAASVHTHPAGSSFSPPDAKLLIEEDAIEVMTVVGANGTWYVLSVEPRTPPPTVAQMRRRYAATVLALLPVYQGIVSLGLATEQHAWQALTDETWESIAPVLGLRYDRIE